MNPNDRSSMVGADGRARRVGVGPRCRREVGGPSSLRIAHVLAPAPVGGLESVVTALATGHRERSHDVRVVTVLEPGQTDHPCLASLAGSDVTAHPLQVPHRSYLREHRMLVDVLRRLEPDLVHTHGYRGDVMGGLAARSAGRTVVSTVHGFTGGGWKNRLYEWVQRRSLKRADAVVCVSAPMASVLESCGVPRGRIEVIPNALASNAELLSREEAWARLELSADSFVVGWVGRLSREKAPDVLLRAVDRLAGDGWTVSVIGAGPEEPGLRRLARELGVEGRLRFHGEVPGAAELYRAFDVFVLSSRSEGTPMSLLEAMAAEVPVVATRVGGVPDVVRHDREALLVPPDAPEALAAAIERVRSEPEAARQRAARAHERLEDVYDVETWLDRYEAVYRQAIERHGEGANE